MEDPVGQEDTEDLEDLEEQVDTAVQDAEADTVDLAAEDKAVEDQAEEVDMVDHTKD